MMPVNRKKNYMTWIAMSVFLPASVFALDDDSVQARIRIDNESENTIFLIPEITANKDVSLSFNLRSTRGGVSGNATTSQSGSLQINSGETKEVSLIKLSVSEGDRIEADFEVYEGARIIARDRWTTD